MPVYEKAGADVRAILDQALQFYHERLFSAGAIVDLLMASSTLDKHGEPKGPAVKHHGRACAAVIRTVPYKDRVKGCGDLEIVIDQMWWDDHNEKQRLALFDHELGHREPKISQKTGMVKTDDLGRPKFDRIEHDFEFGWFAATALRHGKQSIEVEQAQQMIGSNLWQTCIQKFLPGVPGVQSIDVASEECGSEGDRQADDQQAADGSPANFDDSEVTITTGGKSMKTTVGAIKDLPAKIRRLRGAGKQK